LRPIFALLVLQLKLLKSIIAVMACLSSITVFNVGGATCSTTTCATIGVHDQ
jgi:hypothetical protein